MKARPYRFSTHTRSVLDTAARDVLNSHLPALSASRRAKLARAIVALIEQRIPGPNAPSVAAQTCAPRIKGTMTVISQPKATAFAGSPTVATAVTSLDAIGASSLRAATDIELAELERVTKLWTALAADERARRDPAWRREWPSPTAYSAGLGE